jgi:hypothetical protein
MIKEIFLQTLDNSIQFITKNFNIVVIFFDNHPALSAIFLKKILRVVYTKENLFAHNENAELKIKSTHLYIRLF